jgi:hypothetical protein
VVQIEQLGGNSYLDWEDAKDLGKVMRAWAPDSVVHTKALRYNVD